MFKFLDKMLFSFDYRLFYFQQTQPCGLPGVNICDVLMQGPCKKPVSFRKDYKSINDQRQQTGQRLKEVPIC